MSCTQGSFRMMGKKSITQDDASDLQIMELATGYGILIGFQTQVKEIDLGTNTLHCSFPIFIHSQNHLVLTDLHLQIQMRRMQKQQKMKK